MGGDRENGIVIGIVSDLDDPARLGRVRVRFPHLGDEQSNWARLVSPMAGPDRGMRFCPEISDEVLVAFEHGDPRFPFVVGGLWNGRDKPPADDGDPAKNNWRSIYSRSGHLVKLDDTPGAEKIEVVDKDGMRRVVIDSAAGKIQVACDSGDVEVSAPAGSVKVEALSVEVSASASMTLKASGTMSIEASGPLSLKGAIVNIN